MNRLQQLAVLLVMAGWIGGCAIPLGFRTKDLTNDAAFQSGYRAGQVYRVITDCHLENSYDLHFRDERELRPGITPGKAYPASGGEPERVGQGDRSWAVIPAGSLAHIDRITYSDDVYLFPVDTENDVSYDLRVYATITTPNAVYKKIVMPGASPYWAWSSPPKFAPSPWPKHTYAKRILIPEPDFRLLELTQDVPPKSTQPASSAK
jgi:hypothetical protein